MLPTTWNLAPAPDEDLAREHAARLGVSPLIATLLMSRGLSTLEEMELFLDPGLRHLAPPHQYPGLEEAARTMAASLEAGKTPAVWGDYDVDGVTATALFMEFLTLKGYAPLYHLPHRMEEGYGLNIPGVEALHRDGAGLLLTVDCGISDHAPVARARELGMTVVISDHHLPGEESPPAQATVNPRLGECPCPDLAGVGVAFLLACRLNALLPGQAADMRRFLDLVALGTLADVVPLTGQNRILVKNGLLLLKQASRPGVFALKEAAGFNPTAPLRSGQVVFGLAPRINAAGRLGHADKALSLLLSPDKDIARPLARELDDMNRERQDTETRITEAALAQAAQQAGQAGMVLYDPDWHSGIIGIVASRVVEKYHRPVLVLTLEDGLVKGSGRSISDYHLHQGLSAMAGILEGFGGHRQAAGLSLRPENLDALRHGFAKQVSDTLGPEPVPPRQRLDAKVGFELLTPTLLKELEMLQPQGMGNPEPVFLSALLEVRSRRVFGKKDKGHANLKLRDTQGGVTLLGKAWRQADTMPQSLVGEHIQVAYTPRLDTWTGLATIEVHIKDWKGPFRAPRPA